MDSKQQHYPFVSVIIPVLNCAEDIEDSIESLRNQDYPEDRREFIFVDNGSTDATPDVLKNNNAKYFTRKERNRSRALNTGIENAQGEIICTTDVSCRPESGWISRVVESFRDASVACVAGEIKMLKTFDNPVIAFQERTNYMSPMLALERNSLPYLPFADGANASFRRSLFNEIGLFEESFFKGADVEICYRMFLLTRHNLAFDREAVVWEPGEPTLKALLKQRLRMGMGWNLMCMKYPELFRPTKKKAGLRQSYWALRDFLNTTLTLAITNLKASSMSHTAADTNIQYLMGLARKAGVIYGRWFIRFNKIRPVPLDSNLILDFISSGKYVSERVIVTGEEPK